MAMTSGVSLGFPVFIVDEFSQCLSSLLFFRRRKQRKNNFFSQIEDEIVREED